MLYPSPNTTSIHAYISIHALKSEVIIGAMNLLLNKKFNDGKLTKKTLLLAILYHLFMVM
jgi:hypothetical protein